MSEVLKSLDEQVLTLTLNRVAKQNAITRDMYQLLADALKEANGDFGIRVVVITHEGCLLYTSPSPRDLSTSRMPSSA